MALGKTLMVQGTASGVGKSLVVTALCRYFHKAGIRVAPFKSQNMSNNSAVTSDGLEIGRAQAEQARACGLQPHVDMNPILLKPEAGSRAQVIMRGKPRGTLQSQAYQNRAQEFRSVVEESLLRLREQYELVVIEGAGSPAEINLKERDLANMYVAKIADAKVLLVGDIDRGGVFASLVGTLELLDPEERERVVAFLINKFRGDVALLEPGLKMLEQRTGVGVLGVVPHISDLYLADEDALALQDKRAGATGSIDVAIVHLPHISNYDDFQPLEQDPRFSVRYLKTVRNMGCPDLLIIPGSKSTLSDLSWLRETGFGQVIGTRELTGHATLGICGGCQMLGRRLLDPEGAESPTVEAHGLGLLPLDVRYRPEKRTTNVQAQAAASTFLTSQVAPDERLTGYEIHHGRPDFTAAAPFMVLERNGLPLQQGPALEGARSETGSTLGTMLHGIFQNSGVRNSLAHSFGVTAAAPGVGGSPEVEYERLAEVLQQNVSVEKLWEIAGLHRWASD